jgi:hypothetical protein
MINKERLQQWCNKYELTLVDDGNDRYLIPIVDILKHTKHRYPKNIVYNIPKHQIFLRKIVGDKSTQRKNCIQISNVVDVVKHHGKLGDEFYKEIYNIYNEIPTTQNDNNQCNTIKDNGFKIKQLIINELSSKFKEQQSSKSPESVSIEIQSAQHIGTEIKIMCTITIKDLK